MPLAVFASPPVVSGEWSVDDGNTWNAFGGGVVPTLGFVGNSGQELLVRVSTTFSTGNTKQIKVTIADGLEWIDNGASGFPEGMLIGDPVGPEGQTKWPSSADPQHTINNGSYTYTLNSGTTDATLTFRVAQNVVDDYPSQTNPIVVDVNENGASSQLSLPTINYEQTPGIIAGQSREKIVPLDTDVGTIYSLLTIYNYGSYSPITRLFEDIKITLEAPSAAEVNGTYASGPSGLQAMINGGWTYNKVSTDPVAGTSVWEFTLDKRRSYFFGLSPIWHFPSSSFNVGESVTINYKKTEWTYYGNDEGYKVEYGVGEESSRTETYTFSNEENVLPLRGTYIRASHISPNHPGAHGDLGSYGIANQGGKDSTPKWVELEFDTTKVGVTALDLIGEPGTRNIEIQYRKEGETGWPNTATLSKTFPSSPPTLSRTLLYGTELGLAETEYIAALRYKMEHTPEGGGSPYGVKSGYETNPSVNAFYGIGKPGCSSPIETTLSVRDVTDASQVVSTIISTPSTEIASAITPVLESNRVVEAGESLDFSATIKNYSGGQPWFSKTPIIYIRDETGLGISNLSLVSSRGVDLLATYPGKVTWSLDHSEPADPVTGIVPKVYKIDTSGLNDTNLSYEAQYAAATGYHTYERRLRTLKLNWTINTPSDYNDGAKQHLNHDILWVTDTYSERMSGAGRKGDPYKVHSQNQDNQLVVSMSEDTFYYQVKNRNDLSVTTEAKSTQDGAVWTTWSGSVDDLIPISFSQNYQVRTTLTNHSGLPTTSDPDKASYIYIPIPKKGQQWGVLNEGYSGAPNGLGTALDTFGFDSFLADPVSNPDTSLYTITYGTVPTGGFSADTSFSAIGDALKAHTGWSSSYDDNTNMVRIRAVSIPVNTPHNFTMELRSNVPTNAENSVNIYRPVYWQDLTNAQGDTFTTWAQGDPIAVQLSRGNLQGQVFFDGNTNSVWDSGEAISSGTHNFSGWTLGIYTTAHATTPVVEFNLATDGSYSIGGLSRAIAYNLRLTSPQGESYYVGPSNRTYS
ncbi:MAG TPA: hypothetical protein PLV82_00860, partial [bacterium]|nr:hypothetical protein [bacterium]